MTFCIHNVKEINKLKKKNACVIWAQNTEIILFKLNGHRHNHVDTRKTPKIELTQAQRMNLSAMTEVDVTF